MSATNGSNPRLDRIEKLLEQTVRATKESEIANKEAHAVHTREMREMREARAVHTREMREIRGEMRAVAGELRGMARATTAEMRGWARAAVTEARNQRKRTGELDEKITQLAAAQLVTEDKLQRFISSLPRGKNNGH